MNLGVNLLAVEAKTVILAVGYLAGETLPLGEHPSRTACGVVYPVEAFLDGVLGR